LDLLEFFVLQLSSESESGDEGEEWQSFIDVGHGTVFAVARLCDDSLRSSRILPISFFFFFFSSITAIEIVDELAAS